MTDLNEQREAFGRLSYRVIYVTLQGFPGGPDGKESGYNGGELSLISGWGISPGEGSDKLFQYYCLRNSMDRGAWWATIHGVARSWTQLSD